MIVKTALLNSALIFESSGEVKELVFESPRHFSLFLEKLFGQLEGDGTESFAIFNTDGKADKDLSIECLFDPFRLPLYDRKFTAAVQKRVQTTLNIGSLFDEASNLVTAANALLSKIPMQFDLPLEVSLDFSLRSFVKALNVEISFVETSMAGRVFAYIAAFSELVGRRLWLLTGFRQYFTLKELQDLCKQLEYSGYQVLLVESVLREKVSGYERVIVDEDLCELVDSRGMQADFGV